MKRLVTWFRSDIPAGWGELWIGTAKAAVVAFVVLQMKEWFDAGAFDTTGAAADAALIAGGIFALNGILMWTKR